MGCALFMLTLHAVALWHPYLLRFTVLLAPWMAIGAVWFAINLPKGMRELACLLLMVLVAGGLWQGTFRTYQAGWPAIATPQRAWSFDVFARCRAWSRLLRPLDEPIHLALPVNRPLAAFLRLPVPRKITLLKLSEIKAQSAEEAVKNLDGWLVVPAKHFGGRWGQVEVKTFHYAGSSEHEFSLAAYRRLPSGSSGP